MWRNQEPNKLIFGIFLTFVVARYMQWGARRSIFETIRIEFVLGLILTIVCAVIISRNPIDISSKKCSFRDCTSFLRDVDSAPVCCRSGNGQPHICR